MRSENVLDAVMRSARGGRLPIACDGRLATAG
jgi:hypothetical protein